MINVRYVMIIINVRGRGSASARRVGINSTRDLHRR